MSLTTVKSLQFKSSLLRLGTNALHRTGRLSAALALGLSVCLLVSGKAEANTFEFTKIVDTNTPIPGGTGNFTGFLNPPFLDKRNVAFHGFGPSEQRGIYISVDGKLNVVADTKTPIPGGQGNFNFVDFPSLDNQNVAFQGRDSSNQSGIYTNIGGKLNVVADTKTPIPGGQGNFTLVDFPFLDNQNVAFVGRNSSDQLGIYKNIGGKLSVVADTKTPIPGGQGNFTSFSVSSTFLDNRNVAFVGYGSSQQGIYINIGRQLKVVVDTSTPIPNGTGNFAGFGGVSLDKKDVAFTGFDSSGTQRGIYTTIGGKLKVVVDTSTPIPNGIENFAGFGSISLDNGNLAFGGIGSSSAGGIYTTLGGSLRKVIAINDSLDGKIVSSLTSERQALSGNRISFTAGFTDGSGGIYIATLK
jgi:hypothetical protein